MSSYDSLRISGFDHLEFAVADIDKASELYLRMGFERAGTREILERQLRSQLLLQNGIHVLLSQSTLKSDPVARYVERHGDGLYCVAFRCEDATSALEIAANRGARVLEAPRLVHKEFGSFHYAAIGAFGDVRHAFVSRTGSLFAEGFDIPFKATGRQSGLLRIDHITTNVEAGKLDEWCGFYEKVFGLRNTRYFDIHTERSGLYSKVMQSPDGVIKMPVNEPAEGKNQIQEFLDVNHGPGVQHVALLTDDIVASLKSLRGQGIAFLEAPPQAYYDALSQRVSGVSESLREMQEMGILIDGSPKGYLLQIFTRNVVGPFFYEVIQRKGDDGFGEGNFKALFEAIERDQLRRGTLK